MTAKDAYTSACRLQDRTNCPDSDGPDFDFASSPILVNLPNGKRALVAGQKSGMVHALDPDQQGEVLWQTRVGKGGTAGGVQWGSAADGSNVYVAVSDIGRIKLAYAADHRCRPECGRRDVRAQPEGREAALVHASWQVRQSSALQSRAIGGGDCDAWGGVLRVGGRTPAGVFGRGWKDCLGFRYGSGLHDRQRRSGQGRIAGRAGARDWRRMLYVNSGYPTAGGTPGNVLIAFSVDGK